MHYPGSFDIRLAVFVRFTNTVLDVLWLNHEMQGNRHLLGTGHPRKSIIMLVLAVYLS
jgi:hypothetical protein